MAARRDSAVHVSLSSDSPVKQPGPRWSRPPIGNGEPSKPGHPTGVGSLVTYISDGASKTRRRAEAAACRNDRLYRLRLPSKSTPVAGEIWRARCSRATVVFASNIGSLDGEQQRFHALVQPYSSAPLVPALGGVTFGGNRRQCRAAARRGWRLNPTIGPKTGHGRARTVRQVLCHLPHGGVAVRSRLALFQLLGAPALGGEDVGPRQTTHGASFEL